ncbi:hypothetical protein PIB30_071035 [Stylosanthes scabra]|uniref:O-methyltransferase dimerisation domain-containing protein n=1 Tax=Stylosanthes scabra TaxID=79078 RepID=A0ABU6TQ63_9FABA|nr:hypothetical protein [Stylosanthes scabra]
MDDDDDDNGALMKAASLACCQVFSAILNAAVEMNLFDIISSSSSSGGMSASEIASKLPNQHKEMGSRLERMLPSLVAHSLLTCSIHNQHRLYALSPVGQYFRRHQQGTSLASISTFLYQAFPHTW